MSTFLKIAATLTAVVMLLPGCPREQVDLCSGADAHPECFNANPGDMGGTDAADVADDDDGGEPDMPDVPDVTEPCGGECADPTPVCDMASDMCVECLATSACTAGVCSDDNRCVECVETADCADGVCDTTANICVECLTNDQCTDATASLCDMATNTCTACAVSADCAHLDDTTVCDAGECVECLDDDETTRAACGGNSCDPATRACTTTPVESLTVCQVCVADSECSPEHTCVELMFQAAPYGTYCLKLSSTGCARPYGEPIAGASTASGSVADVCGLDEQQTTCEAVVAFGTSCATNGAPECATAGARCETVNSVADTCTYSCDNSLQCPDGLPCSAGYCGG